MTTATPAKKKTARKMTPQAHQVNLEQEAERLKAEKARKQRMGLAATSPTLQAAAAMESYQGNLIGKECQAAEIMAALDDRLEAIWDGNLQTLEAMLFSQATALQSIFASLSRKAANQEYLKQYQSHLTLALKAQAQSRATIEALVELKQPRSGATFIKQANLAQGNQQVNNGLPPAAPLAREEIQTAPSKLLESDSTPTLPATLKTKEVAHERLDT